MNKKTPVNPQMVTTGAKMKGPIIPAPPNTREYSAIALANCVLGTNAGSIAARDGISKAKNIPVISAIVKICQGLTTSKRMRTAVPKANTAKNPLVTLSNFKRFTRSAITPPHNENINTGANVAVVTNPTNKVDSVIECINQNRP